LQDCPSPRALLALFWGNHVSFHQRPHPLEAWMGQRHQGLQHPRPFKRQDAEQEEASWALGFLSGTRIKRHPQLVVLEMEAAFLGPILLSFPVSAGGHRCGDRDHALPSKSQQASFV
jgi:hypothetical protein